MDEYSWASAVGRIRMRQQSLLGQADLNQLIDARDLGTALSVLRDTQYGPYVSELDNPGEFDKALEASLRHEYDMVEDIAPEPLMVAVYRARYDFHNLKVYAKERYLGIRVAPEAFSMAGNFSPEDLSRLVGIESSGRAPVCGSDSTPEATKENLWGESDQLLRAFRESAGAKDAVDRTSDGFSGDQTGVLALLTDAFLDKVYYDWSLKILRRFGYQGLIATKRSEIDLINLRMAARSGRQRIPYRIFDTIALTGGNLDAGEISRAYAVSFAQVVRLYRDTPWAALAKDAEKLIDRGQSLTAWEKQCDDALMRSLRRVRFESLGPMSVVGYILGKETEVRNLRVILSGKQSEIPAGEIRERLREAYV